MSTCLITAFVEGSHRLISRPSLYLHKVGSGMTAFWTSFYKKMDMSFQVLAMIVGLQS